MKYIKKTIYTSILSLIICSASFMIAGIAQAQDAGNISVIFTPDPLFQETNFLPGSSTSGTAQVTNTSGAAQSIAIEAINVINDEVASGEFFGDALDLSITENSTEHFNGTLTEFFDAGQIYLSDLANSATATYDLTVTFNETAENKHQGKNLGFDILIGFQGEGGGESDEPIGPTGGGGGGGSGRIHGLSIFSEASINITDTTATIEWATSYFSTSRVIYCREDQNCVFDFYETDDNMALYGYQYTTAEYDTPANPNGVTHHSITITGLTSETTYNYRVISHASPPTISKEHTFTTLASSQNINLEDIESSSSEEVKVLGEETTPALEIEKNFETEIANPGDTIKYQITITNNGNFDALDVVINETLPQGIIFRNSNQREQTFTLGNIKPNEIRTMHYAVIIDKNIAPGIYLGSTKLSALNHDTIETQISFEIHDVESSQDGGLPSIVEIKEHDEEEQENDEEIEIQKHENTENNETQKQSGQEEVEEKKDVGGTEEEIEKTKIKEWLLWILLLIIAIELYILINKKKKKEDEE